MRINIGIIICDRYRECAGGKCYRSFREREGAFSIYHETEAEIRGYTTCGGCPGGNIEYAPEEMIKNGVTHIHFATGLLVGYPPCPYLEYFEKFLRERYKVEVIMGTHPVPQKYYLVHTKLKTWETPFLSAAVRPALADEATRLRYD